jgi:hypothetical protein
VTAETVAAGFQQFVKNVHDPQPQTKIIAIGLKPTPVRWQFFEEGRKANRLIKAYCEKQTGCIYVNVEPEMLGKDGHPRPELYVSDGEHMTPEGYKIWTRLVMPLQSENERVMRHAIDNGPDDELRKRIQELERLSRTLEESAEAAEVAIWQELRAGRRSPFRDGPR